MAPRLRASHTTQLATNCLYKTSLPEDSACVNISARCFYKQSKDPTDRYGQYYIMDKIHWKYQTSNIGPTKSVATWNLVYLTDKIQVLFTSIGLRNTDQKKILQARIQDSSSLKTPVHHLEFFGHMD